MATREAAFNYAQQRANQTLFVYAIYQSRNGKWLWGPFTNKVLAYRNVSVVCPNPCECQGRRDVLNELGGD